jgi:hypothetical protein
LQLLHGSALRERAEALGIRYSAEPPYEIESSPWLSAEDILTLKLAENALSHTLNKGRFLSSLGYALSATGLSPFSLLRGLGGVAPNHGTDLAKYAGQIFDFLTAQPGVDPGEQRDCMLCDWLGMVKGNNMPPFLKSPDVRRSRVIKRAEKALGRSIRRDEAAVLLSGAGVYADSECRDPVTGLYKVHRCDI